MADDASVDGRTEGSERSSSTRTGPTERDAVPPDEPKHEAVSAADSDTTGTTTDRATGPDASDDEPDVEAGGVAESESDAAETDAVTRELPDRSSTAPAGEDVAEAGTFERSAAGEGGGDPADTTEQIPVDGARSVDSDPAERTAVDQVPVDPAEQAATDQHPPADTTGIAEASDDEPPAGKTGKKGGKAKKRGSFWKELPILLVVAFGLAMLIKTFLVQAFFIPSGSMEQTLHGCPGCSGDRVLVDKVTYRFRSPEPGEIVVFRAPDSWESEVPGSDPGNVVQRFFRSIGQAVGLSQPDEKDVIKRVIAVGGQTVRCCDDQGRVVVDGVALDESSYVYDEGTPPTPFGPVAVPDGRLWVMGDHRNQSGDSRVHIDDPNQGTISVDDVIGKAFVVAWPPSRWDTLGTPSTFNNLATGSVAVAAPYALGLVGALPVMGIRRRWRGRRSRAG